MNRRSDYYSSLSGDVKVRYDEKIKIINNVDPYILTPDYLSADFNLVPSASMIDLMYYLILTHSFYNGKQLKAYKSLQAYKYYEAGYVQQVLTKRMNSDAHLIVSKVMHSQKRNEKPPQVWVIVSTDGAISTGYCTCMAGLGEVCSHVAAVLFS
ncbi:atp-dependent dna helicase [Holotrichia oblita]|uniref:Atp-dependent dna helicase n=1 Tax=Holotrichia oblita TaxID=644536 RepID=A0ACB9SL78_HOLOL|nr:atp-dependent dna helicase [Holotrichia oblita]